MFLFQRSSEWIASLSEIGGRAELGGRGSGNMEALKPVLAKIASVAWRRPIDGAYPRKETNVLFSQGASYGYGSTGRMQQ